MAVSADSIALPEDELLRQQIGAATADLGGLERRLSDIDAELEHLAEQNAAYEMLEQTCSALEKLDELGAATLFWGEGDARHTADHLQRVRDRASDYLNLIEEIRGRRDAVLDEITRGQGVLDILEADLHDLELREAERKAEWLIEREAIEPDRVSIMPWSSNEDDDRLRKMLAISLLVALLLGLVVPLIDLPMPEFAEIPELPERFARLIEEELPPPPPPPPVVEEVEPEEIVEPDPEPVVAEEEPDLVPEIQEDPAPVAVEEAAPEREIRSAGILAFSQSIADLADNRPAPRLGADASINDAGEAAVGRNERSMVTTLGPGSSGGINLSSISRNVGGGGGGGAIEGVQVTRVASSIGVSGSGNRPTSAGAPAGRTDEEIQIVFDRYKSALYRLYNRELRNDPTLRGQVVLQLTIEPDGSVSFCEVQSSGLGAPALEQQIVDRVRSMDFGAKEGVAAVTILYPIDFLPAG